jgi:superfamily II DNA or RNA helicase
MFERIINVIDAEKLEMPQSEKYNLFKSLDRAFPFGGNHIIRDLDKPALKVADHHYRIIGWWMIEWINLVKRELVDFFNRDNTKIKLIIGVPFSEKSFEILESLCLQGSDDEYRQKIRNEFLDLMQDNDLIMQTDLGDFFLGAVAAKKIEIKMRHVRSNVPEHSKLRIYTLGDHIYSLTGSSNDSNRGWGLEVDDNFASVSWSEDSFVAKNASNSLDNFDEKWNEDTIIEFDEDSIGILRDARKKFFHSADDSEKKFPKLLADFEKMAKKYREDERKIIWYLEDDEKVVKELKKYNYYQDSFVFQQVDEYQTYLWTCYCREGIDQISIFFSPEGRERLEIEFNVNLVTDSFFHSMLELDHLEIWGQIYHLFGIEFEKESIFTEITNQNMNELWDDDIFQYLYEKTPGDLDLCEHQENALKKWIENDYRGIFEHATGTYKTATGLCAAAHLISRECNIVVICTPYKQVSLQWAILAEKLFKIPVIRCWSGKTATKDWGESVKSHIDLSETKGSKCIMIFVQDSLWRFKTDHNIFLSYIKKSSKWGLIADEVHNWVGINDEVQSKLFMQKIENEKCHFRLGLSAKVERNGHEYTKNNYYVKHFFSYSHSNGESFIDEFDLKRAINEGFLRKYRYRLELLEVEITDEYIESTPTANQIKKFIENEFKIKKREYARENAFETINKSNIDRLLIYTGPNKSDCDSLIEHIDRKRGILDSAGIKKFTSDENDNKRKEILESFNDGRTQILVSIKCLDEGVNLPIADCAMMIVQSSNDDRQWIQRRGRILRKIKDEDKIAEIIDFIPIFVGGGKIKRKFELKDKDDLFLETLKDYREESLRRISEFSMTTVPESRLEISSKLKELENY